MQGALAISKLFRQRIMVSGIGIDIVTVERFSIYTDKSDTRLSKWFTVDELDYCFRRNPSSNSLAGKFAAKEAVIKALSNPKINIGDIRNIEILNDENGLPFVNKCPLENISKQLKISISHDGGFAIAIALNPSALIQNKGD